MLLSTHLVEARLRSSTSSTFFTCLLPFFFNLGRFGPVLNDDRCPFTEALRVLGPIKVLQLVKGVDLRPLSWLPTDLLSTRCCLFEDEMVLRALELREWQWRDKRMTWKRCSYSITEDWSWAREGERLGCMGWIGNYCNKKSGFINTLAVILSKIHQMSRILLSSCNNWHLLGLN